MSAIAPVCVVLLAFASVSCGGSRPAVEPSARRGSAPVGVTAPYDLAHPERELAHVSDPQERALREAHLILLGSPLTLTSLGIAIPPSCGTPGPACSRDLERLAAARLRVANLPIAAEMLDEAPYTTARAIKIEAAWQAGGDTQDVAAFEALMEMYVTGGALLGADPATVSAKLAAGVPSPCVDVADAARSQPYAQRWGVAASHASCPISCAAGDGLASEDVRQVSALVTARCDPRRLGLADASALALASRDVFDLLAAVALARARDVAQHVARRGSRFTVTVAALPPLMANAQVWATMGLFPVHVSPEGIALPTDDDGDRAAPARVYVLARPGAPQVAIGALPWLGTSGGPLEVRGTPFADAPLVEDVNLGAAAQRALSDAFVFPADALQDASRLPGMLDPAPEPAPSCDDPPCEAEKYPVGVLFFAPSDASATDTVARMRTLAQRELVAAPLGIRSGPIRFAPTFASTNRRGELSSGPFLWHPDLGRLALNPEHEHRVDASLSSRGLRLSTDRTRRPLSEALSALPRDYPNQSVVLVSPEPGLTVAELVAASKGVPSGVRFYIAR